MDAKSSPNRPAAIEAMMMAASTHMVRLGAWVEAQLASLESSLGPSCNATSHLAATARLARPIAALADAYCHDILSRAGSPWVIHDEDVVQAVKRWGEDGEARLYAAEAATAGLRPRNFLRSCQR